MRDPATRVVSVSGLVDDRWAQRLAAELDAARGEPVVIDLTDAILVSRSPLATAIRSRRATIDLSQVFVVSPRISATMLLRRWRLTELVGVYASFEELAAARRMSHPLRTIAG